MRDPGPRAALGRLIAVVLAAPFVVALAIALPLVPVIGAAAAAGSVAFIFAVSLVLALVVAQSRSLRFAGGLSVVSGLTAAAALIFLIGPHPALILLGFAVPVEALWIGRDRRRVLPVVAASAVAASAAAILSPAAPIASMMPWAAVGLYAATLAWRFDAAGSQADEPVAAPRMLEMLDGAIVTFDQTGSVAAVSSKARDILGIAPDLLMAGGLFDRIRVSDRVDYLCWIARCRAGEPCGGLEFHVRLPGPANEPVYKLVTLENLGFEAQGDDLRALLRDASELGHLRDDIERLREETVGLEFAKSRFLASVSHELRTPLNAIIGFSDMLLHEAVSGPMAAKHREQVGLIREAGNHLLGVVNSILDISKIEAGTYPIHVEPFDLRHALEISASMIAQSAIEKGLGLALRVDDAVGEVKADQRAVQQIVINLLSNAVKFTPAGGAVTLAAERDGESIRLDVSDTGIGIAEEDLANIGRPFMQVQNDYTRRYEGAGLGLSLVKGLVGLHGGAMSIESAPGVGTTVRVSLPAGVGAESVEREQGRQRIDGGQEDEAIRKIA